ncbi:MAG: 50S ribosomal protein L25/general stress protein Ctc [Rhodospirillaceae bacterium]
MSDIGTLSVQRRESAGKGAARAIRREGLIPGVIYGGKQAPSLVAMDPRDLLTEMHKTGFSSRMFDLALESGTERTIVQAVQFHPVTDRPVHVDFLRVTASSILTVELPVNFINNTKSPGLKKGGVLNIVRHTVEVTGRADLLPESLEVDLTGWEVSESIHISAVKLPEGVAPTITDRDFTVATIAAPTVAKAEAESEEGEGGEG